jgi:hypothetical protein
MRERTALHARGQVVERSQTRGETWGGKPALSGTRDAYVCLTAIDIAHAAFGALFHADDRPALCPNCRNGGDKRRRLSCLSYLTIVGVCAMLSDMEIPKGEV